MFALIRWQISVAYLFEWLRPVLFALAALLSACVLFDARRRRFKLYAVGGWTLVVFLLPHVALPLYLVTYFFARGQSVPATTANARADELPDSSVPTRDESSSARPAVISDKLSSQEPSTRPAWFLRALLPSALYALLLFALGALYFYRDFTSADAHIARAANARLRNQHERAAAEYKAALRLRDDPHTRKLLALELTQARRFPEALDQFRAARETGEPDDALPFHIAQILEALQRSDEASTEYKKFLDGNLCTQRAPPDPRCKAVRDRLKEPQ